VRRKRRSECGQQHSPEEIASHAPYQIFRFKPRPNGAAPG